MTDRISRPGVYAGFSQPCFDGWERSSQYVEMRDGVRIAVDIIRPTTEGVLHAEPLPVLWTHTPYTRSVVDDTGSVRPAPIESWPKMERLLAHGYVVAVADVRGGGASFGRSDGVFSPAESRDAYEITEWLAAQPWSDGKIAMWGRSYLGITQLHCAAECPPHLVAIFPEMAPWDMYDVMYPGGILRDDLVAMWSASVRALDLGVPVLAAEPDGTPAISWPAAPVDADVDGSLLRAARREHFTNRDVTDFVRSNPHRDSVENGAPVWAPRSPSSKADAISGSGVAIYHYAGWYDGFTRDACLAFASLGNPQKLLIDPNYHCDYLGFDLAAEQLRWFDYWLKRIDNGIMDEPPVTYWMLGANAEDPWRTASTWPVPGTRVQTLYFAAGPSGTVRSRNDGALSVDCPSSSSDAYRIDYSTTTGPSNRWANVYGGPGRAHDFEKGPHLGYPDLCDNDARGLTYTGAPLTEDLQLVGHPVVRIRLESSGDVDLFAYLEVVHPDGFSRYLSEGCLRASHRATGAPPGPGLELPWHPSGRADLEPVGAEACELAFDLQPVGVLVPAGHRIRLTLTGADQASHEPRASDPPPTIRVHCGGDEGSRIELHALP